MNGDVHIESAPQDEVGTTERVEDVTPVENNYTEEKEEEVRDGETDTRRLVAAIIRNISAQFCLISVSFQLSAAPLWFVSNPIWFISVSFQLIYRPLRLINLG